MTGTDSPFWTGYVEMLGGDGPDVVCLISLSSPSVKLINGMAVAKNNAKQLNASRIYWFYYSRRVSETLVSKILSLKHYGKPKILLLSHNFGQDVSLLLRFLVEGWTIRYPDGRVETLDSFTDFIGYLFQSYKAETENRARWRARQQAPRRCRQQ